MKHSILLAALLLPLSFAAARADVPAPAQVSDPAPFGPVPGPAQLRWHEAENLMFIHWGMKTFHPSGNHMGTGTEDPKTFNPKKMDVGQWARVAREAGFKGIIFTTKHHDGFCNWATGTTKHCVKASPWKDGKGDVVEELIAACRKEGLYFGLYVSIKDNSYEARVSRSYDGYADYYYRQLEELSKNYGKIDEYWFDGYGSGGVKVDYAKIAELIRKEQPEAVIYDSFTLAKHLPDRCLRWPGNHGGVAEDQVYVNQVPGAPAGTKAWYPNEGSLILQGNWFHNGGKAVSADTMKEYWLQSVGRGVTPIMNVPPNADGLIDDDTAAKLRVFKAWVDDIHARDVARLPGAKTTGTAARGGAERFAPAKVTDGDPKTYFAPADDARTATIEVAFDKKRKVEGFILQEPIALGQRVTKYVIECHVDGEWVPVFAGKTIGYKRVVLEGHTQVPDLSFAEGNLGKDKDADLKLKKDGKKGGGKATFPEADGARLRILEAGACPLVSNFQVVGDVK